MLLTLLAGLTATPLGQLLVALVILLGVVFVGRLVLSLAWRLLFVAVVVVGILYLLTIFGL
ncbi:hypothetical protein [Halorussus halophilus]|uniref:hypothetical protein n=1 Tax=Halorussus halophilus TaxID=2650975 RepID=UPI001301723E|nr:hypothetical protein [Halorussus halophilus]